MTTVTLTVEGMSCGKCVKAVEDAVQQLNGIETVQVNLAEKLVTVDFNDAAVSSDYIKEAIEDQGYDVL